MKLTIILPIFFIIAIHSSFSQTNDLVESRAFNFIDSCFIGKNKLMVKYLDLLFDKETEEIGKKIQRNTAKRVKWFENYMLENSVDGQPLPYHKNFGVSEDDYMKFIDLKNKPPAIMITDSAYIDIQRNGNRITLTFTNDITKTLSDYIDNGTASISLRKDKFEGPLININIDRRTLFFHDFLLPFDAEIIAQESPVFGNWTGFRWKMEKSNLTDINTKRSDLMHILRYISFGKINANNRIFIHIKDIDIRGGISVINLEQFAYIE